MGFIQLFQIIFNQFHQRVIDVLYFFEIISKDKILFGFV